MRRAFITAKFGISVRVNFCRSLAVRLERILSSQLQTGKARRLVGNDVVVARRSGEAPNIVVAAVEGIDVADESYVPAAEAMPPKRPKPKEPKGP